MVAAMTAHRYPIGPREQRPSAPLCRSCRRFVVRADAHSCEVRRDYERMRNHR